MEYQKNAAPYCGLRSYTTSLSSPIACPAQKERLRPSCIAAILFCLSCLLCMPGASAQASETYAGQGRASWYGTTAHGKQTANGETYNRYALTAAHKGLPFGTIVRVHNLKNGRHVLVRVNDRGPFVKGRVVDVSLKAAQILGMANSGVVPVRLEVVAGKKGKPLNADNAFYVHIADERSAFKARGKAAKLGKQLAAPVKALYRPDGPSKGFALCLGPFKSFKEAHRRFLKLEQSQTAAIGVIEASAQGKVPYYTLNAPQGLRSDAERQQLLEHSAFLWKHFAVSCHPAFYAVSLLAIGHKDFLLAVL